MNEQRPEKVLKRAVLVYLVRNGKVCLALKPKLESGEVKIGEGRRNGYGGGLEPAETLLDAAIRELHEEAVVTVRPETLEKVAICTFHNTKSDGETFDCDVHVYRTFEWSSEPQSTDQMTDPQWYPINCLPTEELMPTDNVWLGAALLGFKLLVEASLGPGQKELFGEIVIKDAKELPD